MVLLVTGGSGSGKSDFAERTLRQLVLEKECYYLATMQPFGEEGRKRIERHREMRRDRNFLTVEQYMDIEQADLREGADVLLECMSNLVANEYFNQKDFFDLEEDSEDHPEEYSEDHPDDYPKDHPIEYSEEYVGNHPKEDAVCIKILSGIRQIISRSNHFVIVTNEVSSDGTTYDGETLAYIRCLNQVNHELAKLADGVVEVVYSIPVWVKNCKICQTVSNRV